VAWGSDPVTSVEVSVDGGRAWKPAVLQSNQRTRFGWRQWEFAWTPPRPAYYTVESRFSRRTVGVSQQYQFFHNVWFHPHVAAGVNITRVRQRDDPSRIYLYDPVTGTSRFEPPRAGTERTSVTANPFIAIGYKAYLSDRAFFRNDLRIAFRGGPNETVLRLGFGFDF